MCDGHMSVLQDFYRFQNTGWFVGDYQLLPRVWSFDLIVSLGDACAPTSNTASACRRPVTFQRGDNTASMWADAVGFVPLLTLKRLVLGHLGDKVGAVSRIECDIVGL